MSSKKSFTITVNNNKTEKEGINYLLSINQNFINPSKESRKLILEILEMDQKFIRAFDLIMIPGHTNLEEIIELNSYQHITLIELKTTKKKLPNLPKGFFFGATESEFELARLLGEKFKFCFVSLHEESLSYELLSLNNLSKIIKNKRIQYQINL